mmetsp:Transcript_27493/g.45372  ORF Transcript_27493/g.45372 Transcript_27493/m.45372 type:complete len:204 (-) Transcript_27493:136-747(-)
MRLHFLCCQGAYCCCFLQLLLLIEAQVNGSSEQPSPPCSSSQMQLSTGRHLHLEEYHRSLQLHCPLCLRGGSSLSPRPPPRPPGLWPPRPPRPRLPGGRPPPAAPPPPPPSAGRCWIMAAVGQACRNARSTSARSSTMHFSMADRGAPSPLPRKLGARWCSGRREETPSSRPPDRSGGGRAAAAAGASKVCSRCGCLRATAAA